jgi:periplasmic protein TonB
MIALAPEDRADLLRWLVSGAVILFAHGAIAASVLLRVPPEDDSAQGAAIVIELVALPIAPLERVEPDTPKEQPEEKVEEKPEEKIETPAEVAMLPEPKPEVPRVVEEDIPPPTPMAAPREGRVDAKPTSVNPLPAWQKEINKLLEKNKRYPSQVRDQRQRMVTRVAVNMDRQGKVTSARIATSSGLSAFDQTALEIIERAQPFPPPPAVLTGAEVPVIMQIWFDPRK